MTHDETVSMSLELLVVYIVCMYVGVVQLENVLLLADSSEDIPLLGTATVRTTHHRWQVVEFVKKIPAEEDMNQFAADLAKVGLTMELWISDRNITAGWLYMTGSSVAPSYRVLMAPDGRDMLSRLK